MIKMMMLHKIIRGVFITLAPQPFSLIVISACCCCASSITSSCSFPAKWAVARWDQSPLVIPVAEQTVAGPKGSSPTVSKTLFVCSPHNPPKNRSQLRFILRWSLYFRCRAKKSCIWLQIHTHTNKQIGTNIDTQRNSQIPKTPHGVCYVITEHTNNFLDQRLTQRAHSVSLSELLSFTANTNPLVGLIFVKKTKIQNRF